MSSATTLRLPGVEAVPSPVADINGARHLPGPIFPKGKGQCSLTGIGPVASGARLSQEIRAR